MPLYPIRVKKHPLYKFQGLKINIKTAFTYDVEAIRLDHDIWTCTHINLICPSFLSLYLNTTKTKGVGDRIPSLPSLQLNCLSYGKK